MGETPLRLLYGQVVQPVVPRATKGAWYRAWRLVSLDGSSLDVANTAENGIAFGYPDRKVNRLGANTGQPNGLPVLRLSRAGGLRVWRAG